MNSQIEITGKMELEEYIECSQAIVRSIGLKIMTYGGGFFGILAILNILLAGTNRELLSLQLRMAGSLLVMPAVPAVLLYFFVKRKTASKSKEIFYTHKFLQSEVHYVFTDEGVRTSTDWSKSMITWDKFYCVRIYKQHISLCLSAGYGECYIIPKRWLEAEHCLPEFEELLRLHMPSGKIKRLLH